MTVMSPTVAEPPTWVGAVFDRIVCGVDGTDSSRTAEAQAMRLLPARRMLELASVVEGNQEPWSGELGLADRERQYEEAQCAIHEGLCECPRARSLLAFGEPGPTLVSRAREIDATLLAAGAPASGRLGELVLGSVGNHLLHEAPCSVLIARSSGDEDEFPRSIVVGHDGSKGAAAAAEVARELAHRFDVPLVTLVARGGQPVKLESLPPKSEIQWSAKRPLAALTEASASADLVVVGSCGLHGVRALGSISERVAHLARCSVLVVREPSPASALDERIEDEVPDTEC